MISQNLILILLAFYFVIMIASLIDKQWAMSLYWASSILINTAVLLMNK
jgi:hypothetical protein